MTRAATPALWSLLVRCREAGLLRRLDVALVRFLHETAPEAPASLLWASAWLAQLEGRGHSGLPLSALSALSSLAGGPGSGRGGGGGSVDDSDRVLLEGAAEFAAWASVRAGSSAEERALIAESAADPEGWSACGLLQVDPAGDDGSSPLVLVGDMLYLRRYWRYERRVAAEVRRRTGAPEQSMPAEGEVRALVARLFPEPPAPTGPALAAPTGPDWQQVACAVALRGRLTIITGGPGTGKTYTAARLLVLMQALQPPGLSLRVGLAAPTGKAAARLRQSIQKALSGLREQLGPEALPLSLAGPATTLHSLLGTVPGTRRFRHDATQRLALDVLFVDEASMVHLEMMALVLEALPPRARLVLLGDKDQLASVEAGAVLGDLCRGAGGGYRPETVAGVQRLTGQVLPPEVQGRGPALAQQTVVLRHSRRFDGPIGRLAGCVNAGDAAAAMAELRQAPSAGPLTVIETRDAAAVLPLAVHGRDGAPGGYARYLDVLAARPSGLRPGPAFDAWAREVLTAYEAFRVLCAVREGPWGVGGLNAAIESALGRAGLLRRKGEWYEGRPVMVTRNQPALGVFNGDIGIVLRTPMAAGLESADAEGSGAGAGPADGGADGGQFDLPGSSPGSAAPASALRAWFLDGDTLRSVSVGRLADVETAFAMTVHKSQGSEFAHVAMVLPDEDVPVLTRELLYTGITRARTAFTLVGPQGRLAGLVATAAARRTRRVSGLRACIDAGETAD